MGGGAGHTNKGECTSLGAEEFKTFPPGVFGGGGGGRREVLKWEGTKFVAGKVKTFQLGVFRRRRGI